MDKNLEKYAIELFVKQYGKNPKECGYPFVDIYRKQSAFLYGSSKEAIEGYKTCQNILRWMMVGYLWPLILAFGISFFCGFTHIINHEFSHPTLVLPLLFVVFWIILFLILWYKTWRANKISKNNVIWLNY